MRSNVECDDEFSSIGSLVSSLTVPTVYVDGKTRRISGLYLQYEAEFAKICSLCRHNKVKEVCGPITSYISQILLYFTSPPKSSFYVLSHCSCPNHPLTSQAEAALNDPGWICRIDHQDAAGNTLLHIAAQVNS